MTSITIDPKYIRTSCIICSNTDFQILNTFPTFPIMAISNNTVSEYYYDYTLIVCNICKCLQLKNLVDPYILYSDIYMNSSFSPSWIDHHEHFSKFIINNTDENNFLEVGANKGHLYLNMMKERDVIFTTLDMYKHKDLPEGIQFIEGNCETFDYKGFPTIILSHVFEHLYSLKKFIENIYAANVTSIFISIPNFDLLLKEQSPLLIHSQHTFFCGFDYILYIFSLYNYRCINSYMYNGNFKSMMFKFIRDPTIIPLKIPTTNIQLYKDIYINKIDKIYNTEIPSNSYIMPSGVYGQLYYYHIKDKGHIVGFLDNNIERHNNRLYGTDKSVYLPSSIDYNIATIIVCDCPYKNEIILGLKKLYHSIKIMLV